MATISLGDNPGVQSTQTKVHKSETIEPSSQPFIHDFLQQVGKVESNWIQLAGRK